MGLSNSNSFADGSSFDLGMPGTKRYLWFPVVKWRPRP